MSDKQYECDIYVDLLPSYIEGMVSEETAEIMKNHLANCKKCACVYEVMSLDLDLKSNKKEGIDTEKKIGNTSKKIRKKIQRKHNAKRLILGYVFLLFCINVWIFLDMILSI